jgi:amyloid beta precursor protein binding protein 1
VKTFGLLGYIRLFENYHANMNLRAIDNPINDLRIVNPWPELKEFCLNFDMIQMDEKYHAHTPYVIILIQALELWKQNVIFLMT